MLTNHPVIGISTALKQKCRSAGYCGRENSGNSIEIGVITEDLSEEVTFWLGSEG